MPDHVVHAEEQRNDCFSRQVKVGLTRQKGYGAYSCFHQRTQCCIAAVIQSLCNEYSYKVSLLLKQLFVHRFPPMVAILHNHNAPRKPSLLLQSSFFLIQIGWPLASCLHQLPDSYADSQQSFWWSFFYIGCFHHSFSMPSSQTCI